MVASKSIQSSSVLAPATSQFTHPQFQGVQAETPWYAADEIGYFWSPSCCLTRLYLQPLPQIYYFLSIEDSVVDWEVRNFVIIISSFLCLPGCQWSARHSKRIKNSHRNYYSERYSSLCSGLMAPLCPHHYSETPSSTRLPLRQVGGRLHEDSHDASCVNLSLLCFYTCSHTRLRFHSLSSKHFQFLVLHYWCFSSENPSNA